MKVRKSCRVDLRGRI